jgi:NADP-dependent 3-hydroxy acid dehydrogenase YdfG
MTSLIDHTVIVTGATGSAGVAVVRRLRTVGATVIGTGRDREKLRELARATDEAGGTFHGDVVDLTDDEAVRRWAAVVRQRGTVDGVIHLVGGWRGGAMFTDNTATDAEWLRDQLVRTTQRLTLAFHDDLLTAPAGRFAIVSAPAATNPTPGNAAYAAAKAAAETWTRALASSFRKAQSGRTGEPEPQRTAATIFVVRMLVDDAMRAAAPDKAFTSATDVEDLAAAVVALWEADAADVNGARIMLTP